MQDVTNSRLLIAALFFPSDCAAVLLLLGFVCPLSQPFPVTAQGPIAEQCVFYARSLLQNITDTLSQVSPAQPNDESCNQFVTRESKKTSVCASLEAAVQWIRLRKAESGAPPGH